MTRPSTARSTPPRAAKRTLTITHEPEEHDRGISRRSYIAIIVSLLCHFLIVVLAASYFFGVQTDSTFIVDTAFSDRPSGDELKLDNVELMTESDSKLKLTDLNQPAQVAASSSGANFDKSLSAVGQGGFFGVGTSGAEGKRIVYIVDSSGSMDTTFERTDRFTRVQAELEKSIKSLDITQKFGVIFFSNRAKTVTGSKLLAVSRRTRATAIRKVRGYKTGGGTNPSDAIYRAMRLKPDTIYFLTDGMFDPGHVSDLIDNPPNGVTIHTFTLADPSGEVLMKRVAEATNGTYRFVPGFGRSNVLPSPRKNQNGPVSIQP